MSEYPKLESLRLADSFLPVGTFTVSYGLEQFIQSGRVENAEDLEALLETYLDRLLGPGELVALRSAHAATSRSDLDALCETDRRLHATTLAAEFRESSSRSGERLLRLELDTGRTDFLTAYAERVPEETPGTHPVVLGAVAAEAEIPVREACLLHCHGFITGLLGAGQRLMAFGHTDAQRLLRSLQPTIERAVEKSSNRTIDDMSPFAPLVDVLAADHERAERRLFVS